MTRTTLKARRQKRLAFLSTTVEDYSSIEDYARDRDEWFAIIGMNLQLNEKYISIEIWLDGYEHETYYVVPTADGRLIVKDKIKHKYMT